ncbi:hypothetical protein Q2K19_13260 [Micromonospora soli]|uniref:hypothetical protein n=1 Tax=Micromonospora sp. NBRC 110009 TaxID=3061627 RepID=UPI002672932B|nr:hypothetical protein [Micromonospora sp. NBRC 110009]WKU01362.1 hypothetical protein Q2K19_13260 [Micromonospora sp. NBRC 110009]
MDGRNEGLRHRIRRGRRRFLLGVFGTLLLFAALSLLVGLLATSDASTVVFRDGQPPAWAETTGIVLAILGLLVEVVALVWAVRSGRYRAGRKSALWAVSWRRRRELSRQVRRDVVRTEAELPLLRHTGRQMAGQRWLVVLFAGLVTMQLGQALIRYTPASLMLFVAPAVLFVLAAWQLLRDARRGDAFLRAHPDLRDASGSDTSARDAQERSSSTGHWS